MTDFRAVGPFGIFRQDDILRAVPVETSDITVEISHTPKTHVEDFQFSIVQKTLIQVELIVKSYDDVETHERFVDTTNERTARRIINLDEDAALKIFGFDRETAPPKKPNEAISKERSIGINVRIWIKNYKEYLRKQAEFDEAMAAMTVTNTDPNYAEEFGKVLKKQPSDDDKARFSTYIPKILNAMAEKLASMKEDEDFMTNLEPLWNKQDGNPTVDARRELLAEYMDSMFSSNKDI